MKPKSGVFVAPPEGGLVYEHEHPQDAERAIQPEYAEFSAPVLALLHAEIDGTKIQHCWIGGGSPHSWWAMAGGRFMRYPLKKGQKLSVWITPLEASSESAGSFLVHWEGD